MSNKVRITSKEKLDIFTSLATLLQAGIPLNEAIQTTLEDATGNQKIILQKLQAETQQGNHISEALNAFDGAFDAVTINMIKSSEESGGLEDTLQRITEETKKTIEFNNKVKTALTYPLLVFALFWVIMTVILIYVIPRISDVFGKLNVKIPLVTRVLINFSDLIIGYWQYVIAIIVLLIVVLIFTVRNNKQKLLEIFMGLPIIRKLTLKMDLAKFTRSLGILLQAGIPIIKSLEYSEEVVMMGKTKSALNQSKMSLLGGKTFGDGLHLNQKLFPSSMLKIVEAAEKSGTLEESLIELSDRYEKEVEEELRTLTSLLEPIMLVVIGVLVGGIMLSIIAPIYQLIGQITPR